MITEGEKRRLKLERPLVVFFYRCLARWAGRYNILLLTSTGRKSGQSRTVPVVYMPLDENYVVAAANLGSDANPGWFFNLKHNPHAQIQIGRAKVSVIAAEPAPDERERLWENWVEINPGYQGFQDKTSRQIPLVILKPAKPVSVM